MTIQNPMVRAVAACVLLCLLPWTAAAQPLQVVHRFEVPPFGPIGGLVEAPGGFLYGATSQGEGGGAIYRVPLSGAPVEVVAHFSRGAFPNTTPILGRDGMLYGTTARGGDSFVGTVYRFDPGTAILTTLHTFDSTLVHPSGRLLQASDGLLYGATLLDQGGDLYALDPATGNIRTLHTFAADDPWGRPVGGFTEGPDGALYLLTASTAAGSIVRFDRLTRAVTRPYTFTGDGGRSPVGGLTRTADGGLYGVTYAGGTYDLGTIFRFDPTAGSVTVVHHFLVGARHPASRLVEAADGSLYGTTLGPGSGTVFRLRRQAGGGYEFAVIRALDGPTTGARPEADLVLASNGFIYGATATGTSAGGGGVFRFDSLERGGAGDPTQFETVHTFQNRGRGWRPQSPPVRGPDGLLYGLTSSGGTAGFGEVYRFAPPSGTPAMVAVVPGWTLGPLDIPATSAPVDGGDGSLYAAIGSQFGTEGRILRITPTTSGVSADTAAIVPLPRGGAGFLSGLSANSAGLFGLRRTDAALEVFRFTPATNTLTTVATLTSDAVLDASLTAAGDGVIYVGSTTLISQGRQLTALYQLLRVHPVSGAVAVLVSQINTSGREPGAPVLGPDGAVFFGLADRVRAVNPSTLAVRTVCVLPAFGSVNAVAITPDLGSVYAVSNFGTAPGLYRCPISGGEASWLHAFDPKEGTASALAYSDNLFFGVTDGGAIPEPSLSREPVRGGTLFRIAGTGPTPPFDPDGDGLTSVFESAFGFSQSSASGDDGASGDPDGDGRTNLEEQEAGTHPRGVQTRYLAEGAVNAFFRTSIALGNAGLRPATVLLRFQTDSGAVIPHVVTVLPTSRATVEASRVVGLSHTSFSTVVESDVPITISRTMTWDIDGYGSHADVATPTPSTSWFFAEGSTSGDFALFYLLQNPQATAVTATVRYLRPLGLPPIERSYTLPAHSRTTIPVDSQGTDLASTDVSAAITATGPIIAERAMYLSRLGQPFAAGHASAGVRAAAPEWFLAEGATGAFFDLFVLVANPNPTPASITAEYLRDGGGTLTKSYTVPAQGRLTIWVDDEQIPARSGQKPLAAASVSTTIRSTGGEPIVVERTMWWPGPDITPDFWYEAHNSPGATATGLQWGIAGAHVGPPNQGETYVLVANPGPTAGQARVRIYFENGNTAARTFLLPARSRTTVGLSTAFPGSVNVRPVSVLVESDGTPVPIVVEAATYTSPNGVLWAAGTNALAELLDPLPPPPP